MRAVPQKKLGLWQQVALIFFTVSGGAYGLEALVGAVGPKWTLLLVIGLPVIWAVPVALMVAELSAAIPEEGGYYVWVRRGLGRFWGFQEGWWTLCYSAVDMALYPVLFVTYLSFFFPALMTPEMQLTRWLICIGFIFLGLLFNLRGVWAVGMNALANLMIVSFPFIMITIWGLFSGSWERLISSFTMNAEHPVSFATLAAGLAIVLWNYCGWDNVSTYASDIENPQKNYPRALAVALLIIILSYILPLLAGFKATISAADWSESSGWPAVAAKLGGPWLGVLGAGAALLSAWALFNSQLLYVSRLPSTMARDGLLPKVLSQTSPRTGAPTTTLCVLAVLSAAASSLSLGKLMIVDILFYTLGLGLEFLALIALREKEPDLTRPFRIPLGKVGLALLSFPPMALAITVAVFSTMGDSGSYIQVGLVAAGIVAGGILYFLKAPQPVAIETQPTL